MTDKEKIRAEIERRITDNTFGAKLELIDILAWLDTFSEEPNKSLDEAAELSANDAMIKRQFPSVVYNTGLKCFDHSDLIKVFKAGAEWLAKQGVSMEVVRGVPWRAVDAFIHDHDYTEDSIIQIRKK